MTSDLVVLVPDKDIEQALLGLLSRPAALPIRPIRHAFVVHPNRDPGVFHTGHELIAPFAEECRYALVCFDAAWEGAPSSDPSELAAHVEDHCRRLWGDRVRCVVIDPEVEAWVWSDSPRVAKALGWDDLASLRSWLNNNGFRWAVGGKPANPKAAFEAAVRQRRLPPSSAIFGELARTVSLRRCSDHAFGQLLSQLREWFPMQSGSTPSLCDAED